MSWSDKSCFLLLVAACGGGTTGPVALPVFSASPIALDRIQYITPLGNLNPPGHTFPTEHIYFYTHLANLGLPPADVFAPADGKITVLRRQTDDQVAIEVNSRVTYRLAHVLIDARLKQGSRVTAGERIGTTVPGSAGIDFGVRNLDVTNSFVNPARYNAEWIHGDKPLRFFSAELKPALYALVAGVNSDKDGKFAYDQPGRLVGNWFHESLSIAESLRGESGFKHLAFVRGSEDWNRVQVSVGGTIAPDNIYDILPGDPDPESVTPASGTIAYNLRVHGWTQDAGQLKVTMVGDNRIRVEFGGVTHFYVR
jgi:hypothetical protein